EYRTSTRSASHFDAGLVVRVRNKGILRNIDIPKQLAVEIVTSDFSIRVAVCEIQKSILGIRKRYERTAERRHDCAERRAEVHEWTGRVLLNPIICMADRQVDVVQQGYCFDLSQQYVIVACKLK